MNKPVADRLRSLPSGGTFVESSVTQMRRRLADPNTLESFMTWSVSPNSMLITNVLRELALNSPVIPHGATDDALIQYGLSQGLSLAAQLISDPASVFPFVSASRINEIENAYEATYSVESDTSNIP